MKPRMPYIAAALGLALSASPAFANEVTVALIARERSPLIDAMADELDRQGFRVTRSPRRADLVIDVAVRDLRTDQRLKDRNRERKKLGNWFGGRRDSACDRFVEARYEVQKIEMRLDYAVDLATFGPRGQRLDRDQVREKARETYKAIDAIEVVDACGQRQPGSLRNRELDRMIERSRRAEQETRWRLTDEAARTLVRKALSEVHMAALNAPGSDDRYDERPRRDWDRDSYTANSAVPAKAAAAAEPAPQAKGNFARRSIIESKSDK